MSESSYKPAAMEPVAIARETRRRPALLAGVAVGVLVAAGAVWSLTHGVLAPVKPAIARVVPVLAATAVTKPMPVLISTFGRVQAIASVALRPRIDGVIARVPVREGQDVKTGDVLFALDDRQARAQLKQAEGALARDRAQRDNAQRDLARLEPLEGNGFASRQQMDQARSAVAGLQGSLAADEAAVESARVQLSYTVITAPIDGRVGSVASKLGNSIRAADATPLVTINQLRPIYVSFSTPQTDFSALQQALAAGPVAVRVKPPGATAVAETGQITFIENAVDTTTNTVGVKATVANDETRLWPGEFVDVLMTVRIDPAAVVVPSEAVQAGPSGTFAFVIGADDKVAMRPVEVSRTISGETVIASGLASGERVVTSGQVALEPGSKVRVKTPDRTDKDRAQ